MLSPVVTVAWKTTDDVRQFPATGQSAGILQLHVLKPGGVVVFCRIDLL